MYSALHVVNTPCHCPILSLGPLELNQEDWTLFAAFQGKNNRPVQPMNGRKLSWV